MEIINVRIIHPTSDSVFDIGLPTDILLRDAFSQLIDENILPDGKEYSGVLKPNGSSTVSKQLSNDKSISENGVCNNDTIQTLFSTPAG